MQPTLAARGSLADAPAMRLHRLVPAILCACALPLAAQDSLAVLKKLDEGFTAVFEKVAPAVVVIEATKAEPVRKLQSSDLFDHDDLAEQKRERDWTVPEIPVQSEGSGFFIRPDGYIVTNRHVVDDAERIEARSYDGRRWDASVVADDERTDIAVLKIEGVRMPVVTWGDSDAVRVGQLVCAIGAPFNQDYSFTCGWVSGKGRNNLLGANSTKPLFEDYIQTDAFINPGNSGGPLFDVEGRVVGMNTLINGLGRGLAFAIPSNLLRDVTDELIKTGKVRRPWLGVRMTSLENASKGLRDQFPGLEHGVLVNTVEAGTPAAEGALRPGDLLTAVDGVPLRYAHDLVRYVQRKKIGQTLRFAVIRKGEKVEVPITTAEQPDSSSEPTVAAARVPSGPGLKLMDAALGQVVVSEVLANSAAARCDLRVGDVITEVGSEPVTDAAKAIQAIEKALAEDAQKGALVHFSRSGKKSWAVIEQPVR
jgi:S1-C subfamily serine protease